MRKALAILILIPFLPPMLFMGVLLGLRAAFYWAGNELFLSRK